MIRSSIHTAEKSDWVLEGPEKKAGLIDCHLASHSVTKGTLATLNVGCHERKYLPSVISNLSASVLIEVSDEKSNIEQDAQGKGQKLEERKRPRHTSFAVIFPANNGTQYHLSPSSRRTRLHPARIRNAH